MTGDLLTTHHPFLDDTPKRMLIDGKWVKAVSGGHPHMTGGA